MTEPAATEITEHELVTWLFSDPLPQSMLAPGLGLPPGGEAILRAKVPGFLGDVDVLGVLPLVPSEATAVECKRVKVQSATFHTDLPGKLHDLQKGVRQANALHELGFHRAWLLVLIVADGRERTDFNFIGRGLTPELVRTIDDFPERDRLHSGVGLAFVEITQPVDKDVRLAGGVGFRLKRAPVAQEQPDSLTALIGDLVASEGR